MKKANILLSLDHRIYPDQRTRQDPSRYIQSHFDREPLLHDNTIYRVGEWRESLERDNEYMSHSALPFIPDIDITGGSRKNREDDLPPLKRKKKHKNNDLSL